ncbi:12881_t:CDS:2 [Acaulospora colombiana]|uniref:12881_t:CDS:1 n=1 Tax=Acaulospora colombiana TaxID=27376 RepID=A0ACA9KWY3_9GLOM|nr:12881_t:CDS:2 [Acaulospora colombiana]
MALASKVFQDMFTCASSSSDNNDDNMTELTLEGESELTFENVMSYIYPNTYVSINWNNIAEFLRVADKFIMDSLVSAAKTFLEQEFRKEPLEALYLADKYAFKEIYKEASKLVLEKLPDYKTRSSFQELSIQTRAALNERYVRYTNALGKLNKVDFTSGYLHCTECLNSMKHNREIKEKFVNKVRQVQRTITDSAFQIFITNRRCIARSVARYLQCCASGIRAEHTETEICNRVISKYCIINEDNKVNRVYQESTSASNELCLSYYVNFKEVI